MRKKSLIIAALMVASLGLQAQEEANQDTILQREVTVEREFQPIIQHAGKLSVNPQRLQIQIQPVEPRYSTYAKALKTAFNFNTLDCSLTNFTYAEPTHNYLEGAIGHPLTRLHFNYRLQPHKTIMMNLYAHHNGQWGRKTWEDTRIGMNLKKQYSDYELYFDVEGASRFYTLYGRYYDFDDGLTIKHYSDLKADDKQALWSVAANVGLKARKGNDFQWRVQTGYAALIAPSVAAEHFVRTHANIDYAFDLHHAGINLFVQNAFYSISPKQTLADSLYNARHGIRLEPFYAYEGDKVRVHAGVNLDLNIGKGQMMSGSKDISFAPSPNVKVEYRVLPELLALYGGAEGKYSFGTLEGYLNMNPYLMIIPGITSHHVSAYTPVDAFLGLKIKPVSNLLIDVYAHYALQKNQSVFLSPDATYLAANPNAYLDYFYSDWQQWKVGAEITYHYQDIVHILLAGNFYVNYQDNVEVPTVVSTAIPTLSVTPNTAYDRPSWDLHLRVDANINSKWSLYSDNIFVGKRAALTTNGDVTLKPVVDLRLGANYKINTWLHVYLELNNLLNRKHDIFYTYQTIGINGVAGVKWMF